jgi:hypothetical protein
VLALSLASGCIRKALTKEELYPFRDLGYRGIEKEELGVTTHELVSCELRQAPLELGLGHSTVVARKGGARA